VANQKTFSGETVSYWLDTTEPLHSGPLAENLWVDVCVVGAGQAGLCTAYQLAQEGRDVVVVDMGPVGGGQTGRTTAHLTHALDDRYFEIARVHGERGAQLAAQSHTEAIDWIEFTARREGIECDFERVNGYLFLNPRDQIHTLDRERQACHQAGLDGVHLVDKIPGLPFDSGPALHFPRQGQMHAMKFLNGLAQAFMGKGGRLFTNTKVINFKSGVPAQIQTDQGFVIEANHLVVATNSPVNDWIIMHTKQVPYRTYVVAGLIPKGSVPRGLFWDTGFPYHYIRTQNFSHTNDLLLIGGEDHKTGQNGAPEKKFVNLEEWMRDHFPMMEGITNRWSGQCYEPVDYMAFIGVNPSDQGNVYIATGDSGNGMTHGAVAGLLLTDLIENRENEWAKLYDPSRKSLKTGFEFLHENMNVALQYADYLRGSEVEDESEIAPGEGAVMTRGLKKVAIYKNDEGETTEFSAVCTHLGGIVHWNSVEKSWDCPCHGSRYDHEGHVISGPAMNDLKPTEAEEHIHEKPREILWQR